MSGMRVASVCNGLKARSGIIKDEVVSRPVICGMDAGLSEGIRDERTQKPPSLSHARKRFSC
jgi:hypothetical protein